MAQAFVEATIQGNKVVIFSKSMCPYCIKAKKALGQLLRPDQIHAVELDQRNDVIQVQNALNEITGGRTVPRVFIGGKFIGGGDDTARLAASGELKELLEGAGAL